MDIDTILLSLSGLRTPDGEFDDLYDERIETADAELRGELLGRSFDNISSLAAQWRLEAPTGRLVCYITLVPLSGQASIAIEVPRLASLADNKVELHLDALGT